MEEFVTTGPFEGGHLFNRIIQNPKYALNRTYFSAELNIPHTTKEVNLRPPLELRHVYQMSTIVDLLDITTTCDSVDRSALSTYILRTRVPTIASEDIVDPIPIV